MSYFASYDGKSTCSAGYSSNFLLGEKISFLLRMRQ